MIERAATRALDLELVECASLAQQPGALATSQVLQHRGLAVVGKGLRRRCRRLVGGERDHLLADPAVDLEHASLQRFQFVGYSGCRHQALMLRCCSSLVNEAAALRTCQAAQPPIWRPS